MPFIYIGVAGLPLLRSPGVGGSLLSLAATSLPANFSKHLSLLSSTPTQRIEDVYK